MATRFFRAGVGTVIYNDTGEVLIFKRAQPPINVWQFQQGGIDSGEKPEVTLWRELKEEVGLEKIDITCVDEVPGWHAYQDLNSHTDQVSERIGQAHRWFFLKLKTNTVIDLTKAQDREFSEWRFTSFKNAVALTSDHKKFIYEMLEKHFTDYILK